jgi:hypothetical protein
MKPGAIAALPGRDGLPWIAVDAGRCPTGRALSVWSGNERAATSHSPLDVTAVEVPLAQDRKIVHPLLRRAAPPRNNPVVGNGHRSGSGSQRLYALG